MKLFNKKKNSGKRCKLLWHISKKYRQYKWGQLSEEFQLIEKEFKELNEQMEVLYDMRETEEL